MEKLINHDDDDEAENCGKERDVEEEANCLKERRGSLFQRDGGRMEHHKTNE